LPKDDRESNPICSELPVQVGLFCHIVGVKLMAEEGIKVIAQNKKARHDYFIEETY